MKIQKLLKLSGTTLLMFLVASCGPKRDTKKKLPDDVARDFIISVQAGDFVTANTYWSQGSVTNIEQSSHTSFKAFCQNQFKCRDFRLDLPVKQKGDYWSVAYKPSCSDSPMSYEFYVKAINGVYYLTYDLWKAPAP